MKRMDRPSNPQNSCIIGHSCEMPVGGVMRFWRVEEDVKGDWGGQEMVDMARVVRERKGQLGGWNKGLGRIRM